jgi:hypothetical protein
LLKVREKEVHDGECEDENEEDDTFFEYCSEDERLNLCILTCSNVELACAQSITIIEHFNIIPSTL